MLPSRATTLLLVASLLAGCQDYQVFYHDSNKYPYGSVDTSLPPGASTDGTPCLAAFDLPGTSAVDESCSASEATGTLYATVEWSTSSFLDHSEYRQVLMAPMVGQLLDSNGDGRVDGTDTPNVVVVTDDHGEDSNNTHGVLRILSGDDGVQLYDQPGQQFGEDQIYPYRYSNVALADVDGDGSGDIVTVVQIVAGTPVDSGGGGEDTGTQGGGNGGGSTDTGVIIRPPPPDDEAAPPPDGGGSICTLAAFNADATAKWVNEDTSFACASHSPAVADLEGDGIAEIILGAMVFDGVTGAIKWSGATGEGRYADYSEVGDQSFALDLDGDGSQEVLAGRTVYNADGTERCEIDAALPDGFPAAGNLDGDPEGEFVLVGEGIAHVHDTDCTTTAQWTLVGSGNGGPPTLADFDADGEPEIGIAEAETYTVYEVDGTVRWSMPVEDASSHATGSSVFDFDGDGRAEVVYADETALWIFDGVTGVVRLHDTDHTSRTLHEYPVVADVDGDGMVEIVIPQGGGHHGLEEAGLYVLGSADGTWMGNRKVWNQHAYSITNINDDLSVPAPAVANWPEYNTFRSGDLNPVTGGLLPDAVPYAAVCEDPCEGDELVVSVRVGNGGLGVMRSGVPISLFASVGGAMHHLETLFTPERLGSGLNSTTLVFRVAARAVPEGIAWVVADDDAGVGQVTECHEENNAIRVDGLVCLEDTSTE